MGYCGWKLWWFIGSCYLVALLRCSVWLLGSCYAVAIVFKVVDWVI